MFVVAKLNENITHLPTSSSHSFCIFSFSRSSILFKALRWAHSSVCILLFISFFSLSKFSYLDARVSQATDEYHTSLSAKKCTFLWRYWHSIPDLKCSWWRPPGMFGKGGRIFTATVNMSDVTETAAIAAAKRGFFATRAFHASFDPTLPEVPNNAVK